MEHDPIKRLFADLFPTSETAEPPLILTFKRFMSGNYEEGNRNLYIVWRGRRALYVGISAASIYNRWFDMPGRHYGYSNIGRVIVRNRPASMQWKIELRHITTDLRRAEDKLIYELSPLYNTMGRRNGMTPQDTRLYNRLLFGSAVVIANEGVKLDE